MSDIPAFSVFSAISELIVTAIVLYTIISNLRGQSFKWRLLGGCLVFELCVNVMYMINRAGKIDAGETLPAGLGALFAVHGTLSLVMFAALVLLYLMATFDHKAGQRTWFQRHVGATWALIGLWILSVGSGEAAFVWRYFPAA